MGASGRWNCSVSRSCFPPGPLQSITYFVPDERKNGGSYQTFTGEVKRIDAVGSVIQMADRREIPIEDVFSVEIVV